VRIVNSHMWIGIVGLWKVTRRLRTRCFREVGDSLFHPGKRKVPLHPEVEE